MEQILKTYGRGIGVAIITLLLFALLFGKERNDGENAGLLKEVSKRTVNEIREINYESYYDYKKLMDEAKKPEPVLMEEFLNQTILTGQEIVLEDYLRAEDSNQKSYPIILKEVLDMHNNSLPLDEIEKEAGVLQFEKSGIYTLVVMVENDAEKKKYYEITIPVGRN